jgi:hypothetical protein
LKKVEGERARQLAEGIAGKHFWRHVPKLSTKFKEILAYAQWNFEEQNKALEFSIIIIIIIYCFINISAHYN